MMAESPRSPERLRVLVVDDHDVVHWGFRLMLTQQPWVQRCLSARNAAEAVELTRRYEPDVALVDLFVGEESGPEIVALLKKDLVVSADRSKEDQGRDVFKAMNPFFTLRPLTANIKHPK